MSQSKEWFSKDSRQSSLNTISLTTYPKSSCLSNLKLTCLNTEESTLRMAYELSLEMTSPSSSISRSFRLLSTPLSTFSRSLASLWVPSPSSWPSSSSLPPPTRTSETTSGSWASSKPSAWANLRPRACFSMKPSRLSLRPLSWASASASSLPSP